MKLNIALLCALTFLFLGCDALKGSNSKPDTAKAAAPTHAAPTHAAAPKPAEVACKSGEKPQILSGTCGGTWKFAKTATGGVCTFVWGPRIACAEGKVSLGREAECYGNTDKPVTAGDKVGSEGDCAKKFGARPMEISYTMQCCGK